MRNKIITLILTVFLIFCTVGCTSTGSKGYTKRTSGRLQPTMMRDLYYDANTKIVYILFNECAGYSGYGYMSPYYAPNGMPYVYNVQTNSLEEIVKED
mgnify:FL=1|nr:MAG TPA: putative peptidyl-prolyl cis-trans isomerase [Caudoviricetes sp.]